MNLLNVDLSWSISKKWSIKRVKFLPKKVVHTREIAISWVKLTQAFSEKISHTDVNSACSACHRVRHNYEIADSKLNV